jgi:hypothetical protein
MKVEVGMSLREELAALEHDQWAHWTRWQIDNASPEMNERWERQITTPYAELSQREKDADREWADKVLAIVQPVIDRQAARLKAAENVIGTARRLLNHSTTNGINLSLTFEYITARAAVDEYDEAVSR